MFRFFSALLDKMGNWFGIIFKMILPAILMYRPIKMFAFSVLVFGVTLGGNSYSFNDLGVVLFYIVYAILVLMLLLFPQVASAMEFALMGYYFLSLTVFSTVGYFADRLVGIETVIHANARAVPLVAAFLAGKILFYIFIRVNRDKIEVGRKDKFSRFEVLR